MSYIKNHKYCIEEKAKSKFGLTNSYELAGYMFENGEMLNLSYMGYQRDEDHRTISQFFSTANYTDAMLKFMRRGNIRIMCSKSHYFFEFIKKPTKEQLHMIIVAYLYAYKNNIEFMVEKSDSKGRSIKCYYSINDLLYDMYGYDT